MTSFFERYRRGEEEEVWAELFSLGACVREDEVFPDAMAVAREFTRRAWSNAQTVHRRLHDLGYRFKNPEISLSAAAPGAPSIIGRIEDEIGVLPLSLKAWYEVFGSIDFRQDSSQRFPPGDSPVSGLGENCQLVMHDPATVLAEWQRRRDEFFSPSEASLRFWDSVGGRPSAPEMTIRTGGVATSCDPIEFVLPELRADGVLDTGFAKMSFVSLVRESFRCGGFPYCRLMLEGKWDLGNILARPEAEKIVPLLKADLLPL